jgi:hypothetical protein
MLDFLLKILYHNLIEFSVAFATSKEFLWKFMKIFCSKALIRTIVCE